MFGAGSKKHLRAPRKSQTVEPEELGMSQRQLLGYADEFKSKMQKTNDLTSDPQSQNDGSSEVDDYYNDEMPAIEVHNAANVSQFQKMLTMQPTEGNKIDPTSINKKRAGPMSINSEMVGNTLNVDGRDPHNASAYGRTNSAKNSGSESSRKMSSRNGKQRNPNNSNSRRSHQSTNQSK